MNAKDFIARVIPTDGPYFVGELGARKNFLQKPITSDDELTYQVQRLVKKKVNVFFSTSSYNNADNRTGKNVKSKKVFYLDLDCKEDGGFRDKPHAIKELQRFVNILGLPTPSLIVDSGNGFHIYYILEEFISPAEWRILANAFQSACIANNFKADHGVTVDVTRILRVPGTLNYKDPSDPKKCTVVQSRPDIRLDQFTNALSRYLRPTGIVGGTAPSMPNAQIDGDDLGTAPSIEWHAKHIFSQCPTMGHMLDTGGAGCSEPLWKSGLQVLAFCVDGKDFIHKISDKHADYSEAETERKFELRIANSKGPTLCTTFASHAGAKCATCEHRTGGTVLQPEFDIKSPIILGRSLADDLPYGYMATESAIYKKVDDETVFVIAGIIDSFTVAKDEDGEWYCRLELTHGKDSSAYRFQLGEMSDDRTFKLRCFEQGLGRDDNELKGLRELMVKWHQKMKAAKMIGSTPCRLGWTKDGGKIGYTIGSEVIWEDGSTSPFSMPANSVIDQYVPCGTVDKWKEAAAMIINTPELQIPLASGFAAPLMELSGVSGAVLAIVSAKSGTGKSSALRTAQAVWGCPRVGMNSLSDTQLSIAKRLGIITHMPAYWDELHLKEEAKSFSKLVFQLGQGKEKSRLNSSANMQTAGRWETLFTVASNESIADGMEIATAGTDAGMARVLEVEMVDVTQDTTELPKAMQVFKQLDYNYGMVGREYAKYLVANRSAIEAKLLQVMSDITSKSNVEQSHRFIVATMATLLVGASIATKLGFAKFDTAQMAQIMYRSFSITQKDNQHIVLSATDQVKLMVDEYKSESVDHIVVVEHLRTPGRFGDVGTVVKPKFAPVMIQMAQQDQAMLLDLRLFKEWLQGKYGAASRYIRILKKLPGIEETKASLSFGTDYYVAGSQVRVLKIPYGSISNGV